MAEIKRDSLCQPSPPVFAGNRVAAPFVIPGIAKSIRNARNQSELTPAPMPRPADTTRSGSAGALFICERIHYAFIAGRKGARFPQTWLTTRHRTRATRPCSGMKGTGKAYVNHVTTARQARNQRGIVGNAPIGEGVGNLYPPKNTRPRRCPFCVRRQN